MAPLEGARFLCRHRELWKLAAVPLAINLVLYAGLVLAFLSALPILLQRILPHETKWYWTVLAVVLGILAVALLLLVCFFTFTAVGCALGGPFYEALSERTEELIRGQRPNSPVRNVSLVVGLLCSVLEEIKKLLIYCLGMAASLLMGLIPFVGAFIGLAFGTVWTLLFLALEFGDHYLSRHWPRFADRWNRLWAKRTQNLGFGCVAFALLLVPITNILLMPVGVVGATILWHRILPSQATDEPENRA